MLLFICVPALSVFGLHAQFPHHGSDDALNKTQIQKFNSDKLHRFARIRSQFVGPCTSGQITMKLQL